MKNQRSKPRKRTKFLIIFLLILIGLVAYYQFLHRSGQVESNIFKRKAVLAAHNSHIWSTEFSPDGSLLASGSVDSTLKIWNKENGIVVNILKHPVGITYVGWSPDGTMIATGAYDGKLRLWKLPEGSYY